MFEGHFEVPKLIPIILVYGIILTEYYLFMFIFIPAYQQQNPKLSILISVEFTIFYILLHLAYYQAQYHSPGHPPKDLAKHYLTTTLEDIKTRTKNNNTIIQNLRKKDKNKKAPVARYQSNVQLAEDQLFEEEDNFDIIECIQQVSYCFKCQNIKLPRAHHCKECNHCVLRMDHHCPWTNNCVGLKNHRFFCQFILYALFCMYQCVYFIVADYLVHEGVVLKSMKANSRLLCGVCAATSFGLDVSLTLLLGFHLEHLSKNITTVEYHIKEIYGKNPFSKNNSLLNLKEVFGDNYTLWFLPIRDYNRRELQQTDLFEV